MNFSTLASAADERVVLGVKPHRGLPIAHGRVVELGPEVVVLESQLGTQRFARNKWSDVPASVEVGTFVGLKHYGVPSASGEVRTILNLMPFPGEIVERGVVEGYEAGTLHLVTLKGKRALPAPKVDFAPGASVEARRAPSAPPEQTRVSLLAQPFPFIGKLVRRDSPTQARLIDAWGDGLGDVSFNLENAGVLAEDVVAGDLVEVAYRVGLDGLPVIVEAKEKELSPVYFGEITRFSPARGKESGEIVVLTLQRQTRTLGVTPDTFFPIPIQQGDFADIGYERGTQTARFVVKE